MKRNVIIAIGFLLTVTSVVAGQAPAGPPKPGPEHQKLAYFAGKWANEGDVKASPFGPAGKFTFTQKCEWFEGSFALVCHSDGMFAGNAVKSLSILGYDPQEKTYTYYETNTIGESFFSRGMVEGDTWTWTNEAKMGGKPIHSRFTLKQVSPDSATYKFEVGMGDEPLKLTMEGKQIRMK